MAETVKDYSKDMKKKFKAEPDRSDEIRKQLEALPDDALILHHDAYPSNIHINAEMKRRGLVKVK